MTTVTVYRSTDASAPSLTGAPGSLLSVLDACLVNGYGSQPAAGWTKPFSNSGNVGCYKNSAVDGTGFCLSVNDSGPGAASAREARMTGFATLSAVATGTGQFPTSGQLAIGSGAVVCRKSVTADSTARAWTLVADDTVFYLFTETGDYVSPTLVMSFMFGDIFSYATSDAYRCMIIGRNNENNATYGAEGFSTLHATSASFLSQTMIGHYLAASWTGVGGSIGFGKHIDHGKAGMFGVFSSLSGTTLLSNTGSTTLGIGFVNASAGNNISMNLSYPNAPDGGLYVSPIWIHHGGAVRGYFKGLWAPCHTTPLGHNQTYNGAGVLAGKSFLSMALLSIGANVCQGELHIETSSTWS